MSTTAERPIIIEAAINGPTRRSRNPHVPITPEEIASDALACFEAGAAIVHQHDSDGAASAARTAEQSIETYRLILAERPDAIVYPTATFVDPVSERWGAHRFLVEAGMLRTAYADPGSVNLGPIGAAAGSEPSEFVYVNSHRDFAHQLDGCRQLGLGPNIAIFEPGFLRVVLAYAEAGTLPPGALVKLYFGGGGNWSFGLPPWEASLDMYCSMLDGFELTWAVAVLGGDVVECGMAGWALERGGHVRVGLEDHRGPNTPSNVDLVRQAVDLIDQRGLRAATPDEAADIIGLSPR